jgi:pimeloyl-ACP methyl ester carboxylesterase
VTTAALPVHRFQGRDGVELVWREVGAGGAGRPVVLLHGLLGSGAMLADGELTAALAALGRPVILPDLRGHGDSGRPREPGFYPPDVLADDGLALIDALGLSSYDLGGYSLGGKLTLRLLARGARPARAFVAGQGLDGLDAQTSRTGSYRSRLAAAASGAELAPGSPEARMAQWAAQAGFDPLAVSQLLDTMVSTPPDALRTVPVPVLIVGGEDDPRSDSADELAGLFPDAKVALVPGDHLTALSAPELAAAVAGFLGG